MAANRDFFYLREVILGLRNEYIENQKKLEELKKYLVIEDKSVKDTDLYMNRTGNKYFLIIRLQRRNEFLRSIIQRISRAVSKEEIRNELMLYNGFSGRANYIISNDLKAVDFSDANTFYGETDHLLSNDFNTELRDTYDFLEDAKLGINLSHQGIMVLTDNSNTKAPTTGVDYHADKDQLVITSYHNCSSPDGVQEVLEAKIPYAIFGKHTYEAISSNPDRELGIELSGYTYDNYNPQYFKFIKDEDKKVMQLKRVK